MTSKARSEAPGGGDESTRSGLAAPQSRLGSGWYWIALLFGASPFLSVLRPDNWTEPLVRQWTILWSIGLLAVPGFIACLVVDPARLRRTALARAWVQVSLLVLIPLALRMAWGFFGMLGHEVLVAGILIALGPLALAVCSGVMLWRFERLPMASGSTGA